MIKEWLNWINASVAGVAFLLLAAAAFFWLERPPSIAVLEGPAAKSSTIEHSFSHPKEGYDAIEQRLLMLKSSPVTMQLPDLRNVLNYYGKNNRPDADPNNALMYFGFSGDKTIASIVPGEKKFLMYDRKSTPAHYTFSPDNIETHLWIEISPQGPQPTVQVYLRDENGSIIREPATFAKFTLQEKPAVNTGGANNWEIGKQRVDGTLLARQRARWFGSDLFLEKHGGPEYEFTVGKQRIDFGDGQDAYSIFVGKDSVILWDGTRWKVATPGDETLGKPIMVVKKVDEKLMNFELWDPEGKSKVTLNLLKSSEAVLPPNLMSSFHFLGAKTLSQFVFEINKQRMTLSPQDWLLHVDKEWRKLATPEEIDDFVDRRAPGFLFIFDAVEKHDDHQVLSGTLFNRARTVTQHVEIPLQQTSSGAGAPPLPKGEENNRKLKEIPMNKSFDDIPEMPVPSKSNGNERGNPLHPDIDRE
jgi:hypothetical protein